MDNKKVTMTIKEIKRVEVVTLVETGKITGNQAVKMMLFSPLIHYSTTLALNYGLNVLRVRMFALLYY